MAQRLSNWRRMPVGAAPRARTRAARWSAAPCVRAAGAACRPAPSRRAPAGSRRSHGCGAGTRAGPRHDGAPGRSWWRRSASSTCGAGGWPCRCPRPASRPRPWSCRGRCAGRSRATCRAACCPGRTATTARRRARRSCGTAARAAAMAQASHQLPMALRTVQTEAIRPDRLREPALPVRSSAPEGKRAALGVGASFRSAAAPLEGRRAALGVGASFRSAAAPLRGSAQRFGVGINAS